MSAFDYDKSSLKLFPVQKIENDHFRKMLSTIFESMKPDIIFDKIENHARFQHKTLIREFGGKKSSDCSQFISVEM